MKNVSDDDGQTPLHVCAAYAHTDIARLLLRTDRSLALMRMILTQNDGHK